MTEAVISSETSVLTIATRRNISEGDILLSPCRGHLICYMALTGLTLCQRRKVFPVRYELGFYISEDDIPLGNAVKT
jgi:hypothetical protein